MNTSKAKQLWLWMGEDLVYLQAKLRTDKYGFCDLEVAGFEQRRVFRLSTERASRWVGVAG